MQTPHHHHPPVRLLNYRASPAISTVSTRLRQAWLTSPSPTSTAPTPTLTTTIRALQAAPPAHLARMLHPRTKDSTPLRTSLRAAVYHSWNHVFWDVARLLGRKDGGDVVGHLHPPREGVFAVRYPAGEREQVVEERVFGANVLVVPAFLDGGVVVRFEVGGGEGECDEEKGECEEEKGEHEEKGEYNEKKGVHEEKGNVSMFEFDSTETEGMYNGTEVYWIRKGERVRISVDADYTKDRSGITGVFVYGILCDCKHTKEESSVNERTKPGRRKRKRDEADEAGDPDPETVAE